MYIAVVKREVVTSTGQGGAWTSFTGPDKNEVTSRALSHMSRITRAGTYRADAYHVEVGELIWRADTPAIFTLVPLSPKEV